MKNGYCVNLPLQWAAYFDADFQVKLYNMPLADGYADNKSQEWSSFPSLVTISHVQLCMTQKISPLKNDSKLHNGSNNSLITLKTQNIIALKFVTV